MPVKADDGTYSFANATIEGEAKTLTVSLSGDGTVSTTYAGAVMDNADTGVTFTGLTTASAQEALRSVTLSGCRNDSSVKVIVDGNESSAVPAGVTLTEYNGHYFMYVPGKVSWSSAYNAAKQLKLNGMQGYLATLTSMEEYNALHNAASNSAGWIGGTLMVYADGSKIDDEEALSQVEGTFKYQRDYDDTKATAVPDYYWACGPEAGTAYDDATLNSNSKTEPNAFKRDGSDGDKPWIEENNSLKMTLYECCLVANNEHGMVINDIAEPGYSGNGYADGYFVEFGGYDVDPGGRDDSLTGSGSYTFTHAHSFGFSAKDGVITAKCSNSDNLCDLSTDGVELWLPCDETWYMGTIDSIWSKYDLEDWEAAGLKEPTDVTITYSATKDGDYSDVANIKNAGYYKISVTTNGVTATSSLKVKKRYLAIDTFAVMDKPYDGTTNATVDDSGTSLWGVVEGESVGVSATCAFEDKNVGEHKEVTATNLALTGSDAGNYELHFFNNESSEQPSIKVFAAITAREVTLNWEDTELEYTGSDQVPTCTVGNVVDGETVGVNVSGGQSAVGNDYTATAELTGVAAVLANYKLPEAYTTSFSIVKASISPSVSITGWTYGGTANTPSVAADSNPGSGDVTYEYSVKGKDSWSDTVPTDAGEYTVKATVAETTNYKEGTGTADFSIAPKSIEGAAVVLGPGLKANGKEQEQAVESVSLAGGTKLTASDFTVEGNKATKAGSYTLTVKGCGNYGGSVTAKFTVADNPDLNAAEAAVKKIDAIGEVEYTQECKEAIEAARKAYDALTDEQKAYVDPAALKKLEDAEAAYKQAEKEAAEKGKHEPEKKGDKKNDKKLPGTGDDDSVAALVAACGAAAAAAGFFALRRRESK